MFDNLYVLRLKRQLAFENENGGNTGIVLRGGTKTLNLPVWNALLSLAATSDAARVKIRAFL